MRLFNLSNFDLIQIEDTILNITEYNELLDGDAAQKCKDDLKGDGKLSSAVI